MRTLITNGERTWVTSKNSHDTSEDLSHWSGIWTGNLSIFAFYSDIIQMLVSIFVLIYYSLPPIGLGFQTKCSFKKMQSRSNYCKVVHKLLHLAPYFKRSTIWFSLSAIDSESVFFIFNDQLHVFFINQLQVSSIFQSHSICAMSKMRPFQLIHFHCKINLQSVNELESFECSIPHDFMEIPRIYTI